MGAACRLTTSTRSVGGTAIGGGGSLRRRRTRPCSRNPAACDKTALMGSMKRARVTHEPLRQTARHLRRRSRRRRRPCRPTETMCLVGPASTGAASRPAQRPWRGRRRQWRDKVIGFVLQWASLCRPTALMYEGRAVSGGAACRNLSRLPLRRRRKRKKHPRRPACSPTALMCEGRAVSGGAACRSLSRLPRRRRPRRRRHPIRPAMRGRRRL
mmetsp:Transcript_127072/g.365476  ORF Transcript_127072/g.365476 Transcript_127072/m.365476 type:complete len:213 (+) Transcript_127072:531-1169(+)